MNYLIVEGYRDAAAHFLEESGTQLKVDLRTIEERVAIRKVEERAFLQKPYCQLHVLQPRVMFCIVWHYDRSKYG